MARLPKVYKTRNGALRALEQIPAHDDLQRYLDKADDMLRKREESYERCDTDGFLSQWALQVGAQKERVKHRLAEHGNHDVFRVLYYKDTGKLASTKLFIFPSRFHYGSDEKWLVDGEWITDYKRESNFHKRGLAVGWIVSPAYVDARSPLDRTPEPRGLSGCGNLHYRSIIDWRKAGLEI